MALNFMTDNQAEVFTRMARDYTAGKLTNQESPEVEQDRLSPLIAFRLSSELAATMRHDAMRRRVIRCLAPSGEKLRFSNKGQVAEVEVTSDLEKALKSKKVISDATSIHAGRFTHNGSEVSSGQIWIALDPADSSLAVERLSIQAELPEWISVVNNNNSLWPTNLVLKVRTFGQYIDHAFSGACGTISSDRASIIAPDVVLLSIDGYGFVMIPQQGSIDDCQCGDAETAPETGYKFTYLSTDRIAQNIEEGEDFVIGSFSVQVAQSLLNYTHSQTFTIIHDTATGVIDIRDDVFEDSFWSTLANRFILRTDKGKEAFGKLSLLTVVGKTAHRIASVDITGSSTEKILSDFNASISDYDLTITATFINGDTVFQINKDPWMETILTLSGAENCELISQAVGITGTASTFRSGAKTRLELVPLDPRYFGDRPGFYVEKYFGGGGITRGARISIYQLGARCSDMSYGKLEANINSLIPVSPPPDGSEKKYTITPN